ncbi:MAG: hypothetical protein JWN68_501 [Nocardioides sp.]|jgi:hypothetical protein|nr:hypothetical protein [Nocardioides sp.]
MPSDMADPDVSSLPRTWRPFGARIAVIVLGTMLLLLCTFAWLGFDPEVRAKFTFFQRSTLVFLGLLAGSVGHALTRSRVVASEKGLAVVNGYRRHDYEWPEVLAVHLPPGAPWATIDLADGTTASLLAIQGSDGARARTAVRTLRALIDREPV